MKNNKGQSLIDVIFSMGIVVLVLTGVVVLVVNTSKVKRMTFERQKAVELSQKLIDTEVKAVKDNPLTFWSLPKNNKSGSIDSYNYIVGYNCTIAGLSNDKCDVTFTVNWEDGGQSLEVKRFFSRQGI